MVSYFKLYLISFYLIKDCASNSLGVKNSLKYVPDAAMTGYNLYTSTVAHDGRLDGSGMWRGVDSSSYLQVDLGRTGTLY